MTDSILQVRVKPGARTSVLVQADDGTWVAHTRAAAVDGKANAELIELVARHFGVRKAAVSIKSGAMARIKRIRIEHVAPG